MTTPQTQLGQAASALADAESAVAYAQANVANLTAKLETDGTISIVFADHSPGVSLPLTPSVKQMAIDSANAQLASAQAASATAQQAVMAIITPVVDPS